MNMTPEEIVSRLLPLQPLFDEWDELGHAAHGIGARGTAALERHKRIAQDINRKAQRGEDVSKEVAQLRSVFTDYESIFAEWSAQNLKLAALAPRINEHLRNIL